MNPIKALTGNHGDFSGIVLKAAAKGDWDALKTYLEFNPNWLNQEGPHGRTVLWEAANKGRTQLVENLLCLGAEVNCLGSYYTPMLVELSPLAVAEMRGFEDLAKLLKTYGAKDSIYSASYRGDTSAVEYFAFGDPGLVNCPSREAEDHPRMGYMPVHYAAAGKKLNTMQLLVNLGAKLEPYLPLLIDWAEGNNELFQFLTQSKRDPAYPKSPKSEFENIPVVDRPDWLGFPAIVDACRGNHNAQDSPSRVQMLLQNGANVNVRDHKGKTALHRAAQAGFPKITQLLLSHKADVAMSDEKGETPLFDAAKYGKVEVINLLVAHGADVHHHNLRGETPLFAAARHGHIGAFQKLMDLRANLAHRNLKEKTVEQVLSKLKRNARRVEILDYIRKS